MRHGRVEHSAPMVVFHGNVHTTRDHEDYVVRGDLVVLMWYVVVPRVLHLDSMERAIGRSRAVTKRLFVRARQCKVRHRRGRTIEGMLVETSRSVKDGWVWLKRWQKRR